jgi:lipopolysaccharide export system permease protein
LKILDKFLIKTFIGPFILTFFITLFILEMQFLWKYFEDMVGKGLEASVLVKLLFYASASLVSMALPLAILLSSIMTFGNLGENYELVSMKSAGISLNRIMRPLFVFSIFLAIVTFYFSNNILPVANLKFKSLLYDVMHQRPALDFKPGVFYSGIDGYVIRIEDKSKDGQILEDVLIYDHTSSNTNRKVIMAETGKIFLTEDGKYLIMQLFDGNQYDEIPEKDKPLFRSDFEKHTIRFNLSGFQFKRTDEDMFKSHYQMLNLNQLQLSSDSLQEAKTERIKDFKKSMDVRLAVYRDTNRVENLADVAIPDSAIPHFDSLKATSNVSVIVTASNLARASKTYAAAMQKELRSRRERIARHEIEYHRKFSLSIACIILFFVGAPMGAIIRKGGLGMPFIVSVIFFLIYHISSITGEKLVKQLEMPAWQGMWVSTVILAPVGAFLTYKASTDSILLDSAYYTKITSNLKRIFVTPFAKIFSKRKQ